MQAMFEQNLRRFSQAPDQEEVKELSASGKYKIDLLDGNDEEDDLQMLNNEEMDEDEKKVK
jgi:hypothetical protein